MKRTVAGSALTLFVAAGLVLTGCDQLAGIGEGGTGPGQPPTQGQGNISLGGTEIPFTEMVQVTSEDVTIGGTGDQGAFIANRTVSLSPYAIGKYEVTRRLYMEVMSRMYDDLKANGYAFYPEVQEPAEGAGDLEILAAKGEKAAKFVEFLGGDVVKVERAIEGDYLDGVDFSDGEYFSEANLELPMGSLQWHDAIIFTNYLSLLTGKTPVYSVHKYLGWDGSYSQKDMEKAFGADEGDQLYLYDSEQGQSALMTARDNADNFIRSQRNPVSWIMSDNWKKNYLDNLLADSLALMPNQGKQVYTLQNVITNQRFVFNGVDGTADGYRLPTEAEWEFAARGGMPDGEAWNYLYAGSAEAETVANISGSPVAVDAADYTANSLSLAHMSGNVAEWVYDSKGSGSGWNMEALSASAESEANPVKQVIDYSDDRRNEVWRPLERILRGGSYSDPAAEVTVFARVGRNQTFDNGITYRDGFARGDKDTYGRATADSVAASRTYGLRLAAFGLIK